MFATRGHKSALTVDAKLAPRSRWTWIATASWVTVGIVIGYIYGHFGRDAFALTAKTEWDVADILTVLITLIVALYVQQFVGTQAERQKAQRAYLVELAGALTQSSLALHSMIRTRPAQPVVVGAIRRVTASTEELRHALQLSGITCTSVRLIEEELRNFRRLLGDFPAVELTLNETLLLDRSYSLARRSVSRLILELHSG